MLHRAIILYNLFRLSATHAILAALIEAAKVLLIF
ncbi:hypothetical protein C7972_115119 [Arenibacter sp. ARW7G5Y1]|nr:hypothetical protein C7972_115119 [Arenibacter sp. ARW7G5Y1]